MQGYDSVMIDADIELGATEQKFNLVIARQIQKEYEKEQQIVLTLPVLPGIDGTQRMSKSLGNYIGIDEKPAEIYGKVMSVPDELIYSYFELVTDVSIEDLKDIRRDLANPGFNPRDMKKRLARNLVEIYHGKNASADAEQEFEHVIVNKQIPDEIAEFVMTEKEYRIDELMIHSGTAASKSDARRLIQQGGVSVDGERISDPFAVIELDRDRVLKVGKRKFARIRAV